MLNNINGGCPGSVTVSLIHFHYIGNSFFTDPALRCVQGAVSLTEVPKTHQPWRPLLPSICFSWRFTVLWRETFSLQVLSWAAGAAITKFHRLGSLRTRNEFSHSPGGCKSKIRVPEWSGSGKSLLPGLQMATLSPRSQEAEKRSSFDFI